MVTQSRITARPLATVVEVDKMGGFPTPSMFSAQPSLLSPMTMLKLSVLLDSYKEVVSDMEP
jgi:hypothetical protein